MRRFAKSFGTPRFTQCTRCKSSHPYQYLSGMHHTNPVHSWVVYGKKPEGPGTKSDE